MESKIVDGGKSAKLSAVPTESSFVIFRGLNSKPRTLGDP
jgi:hypothetical protein